MPVFISYTSADRSTALMIDAALKRNSISTYLDVLDAESNSTDNITEVITKNIVSCSHMIALVSDRTKSSWWVPFEIGEATISDRRIASFKVGDSTLPEYLSKWPIMTKDRHLQDFIRFYHGDTTTPSSIDEAKRSRQFSYNTKSPQLFHDNLKRSIRGY